MQYGKRYIKPGYEYDKYFGKPDMVHDPMGDNTIEYNVIDVIPNIVKENLYQTKKIADVLYSEDTGQFCENIWNFLFNHIQYAYDEFGKEQFKAPWYSWATREKGIDCDCFTIFALTILLNKGVQCAVRICKYPGENPRWQHIYVIVPKPNYNFDPKNRSTYWVIDPVIHQNDTEKDYLEENTYLMSKNGQNGLGVVTEYLHGFETEKDIITEILTDNELNGLSGPLSDSQLDKIKNHLEKTKKWIGEHPTTFRSQGGDPVTMIKMLDYALNNWDKGEDVRNRAFEILAQNEARYNREVLKIDDDDLDGFIDDDEYEFSATGDLGRTRAERRASRKARRSKRKEKKSSKKTVKTQKRSDKKAERKEERQERKDERKQAQGFFRKVGVTLKQGGKATFVKYNPAVIAARQGFLQAVRLNLFRLASRLAPAYGTEAQARAKGINYRASKKMLEKVDQIFDQKLQGSSAALKAAIKIGALKKGQDFKGLIGIMVGLGDPVTVTSLIAAAAVIADVINSISDVEDEYGVEGLGYIDDDAFETEMVLFACEDIVNGNFGELGDLGKTKVDTAVIVSFIKKMFQRIKQKRELKKGMTKEERKAYNKEKREERKQINADYKKHAEKNNLTWKDKAANLFFTKTDNARSGQPVDDSQDETVIDLPKSTTDDDVEETFWQKNKNMIIIGLSAAGALAGVFYMLDKKAKEKELQGLEDKKTAKKIPAKSTKKTPAKTKKEQKTIKGKL